MRITITYDNELHLAELKSGWGFSCAIENERKILFDTGWDGAILLSNMKALGIDPDEIDIIVLSHAHWDHIGGLTWLLDINPDVDVYVPSSFSKRLKSEIASRAGLLEVDRLAEICDRVYTTGVLGTSIKEQSLVLETKRGLIVITGCAHPGLPAILYEASSLGSIYGVIGGLHGFEEYDLLNDLTLVLPCHCTVHKSEIAQRFPDVYLTNGAGWSREVW